MYKFRFVLLSLILLSCTTLSASGVEVDGIHYQLDISNQTASVTFTGEYALNLNTYQGALVIPSVILHEGTRYSVTSIGMLAFNSTDITSVTIPSTVTSVYNDAFLGCLQLDTIYCRRNEAPSLTNGASFSGMRQGIAVEVPAGALDSYSTAKGWKSLTLAEDDFRCGENLTWSINATLDTLSIVGSGAMYDYGSVSAVPWNAYLGTIRYLQLSEEITHIGDYCFIFGEWDTIRLPRDLQSLGYAAFADCWNAKTVILNDRIETIGIQAFAYVPVNRWVIPATVRSIGASAFLSNSLAYFEFLSDTPPSVHAEAFGYSCPISIHVPCQAIPDYRAAMPFDFVGADGYSLQVMPNDISLGSTAMYQYNCDSALLTATPNALTTFLAWSDSSTANPRVLSLEQDCTLTAIFVVDRSYRITFLNSDSSILKVDSVLYGEMPVYEGAALQMPDISPQETVLFKGWYPALQPVTKDATYMARYHYIGTTYDGLCFHADTASTVKMSNYYWNQRNPQLQYSEDGRIWYDWDYSQLSIAAGDSLFFRGNNPDGIGQYISWLSTEGYSKFVMTGRIRATGNILSLIDTTMTIRTLPDYCFQLLFNNCKSLVEVPDLDVDTIGVSACANMLGGTSIRKMPSLPAMHISRSCYEGMFAGCTNLAEVQPLPALELAESCYNDMFQGCTALKQAQTVLPAELLEKSCYWGMYGHCSQLEVAPEIMAEGLAPQSCIEMFARCTNLHEICVHFYFWDDTDFLNAMADWVAGVSPTGAFYCPNELEQIMDNWHIPVGWLVNPLSTAIERVKHPTNNVVKTLYKGRLSVISPYGVYTPAGVLIQK